MKKICVVTATRAEYGLLRRVINEIYQDKELELCLVVTGTHLMKKYGYTIEEIEKDGFPIAQKIEVSTQGNSEKEICYTMGEMTMKFADDSSNATNMLDNYNNLRTTIQNQRLSIMGVDTDEEAMDMMKFQQAYNLNSKMMSVMNEIYDKLINGTGL